VNIFYLKSKGAMYVSWKYEIGERVANIFSLDYDTDTGIPNENWIRLQRCSIESARDHWKSKVDHELRDYERVETI